MTASAEQADCGCHRIHLGTNRPRLPVGCGRPALLSQVTEANLSRADSRLLPGFGPGEGIISGQAVRFPLVVKIKFDEDLRSKSIGDEDFVRIVADWADSEQHAMHARSHELEEAIRSAGATAPK